MMALAQMQVFSPVPNFHSGNVIWKHDWQKGEMSKVCGYVSTERVVRAVYGLSVVVYIGFE